ncbi:probable E3 ubiquitin-protein ligase XBOS36 [Ananas comosus]|uniref:RING-type E3 ubiquitin transferase n=1 Tax=Ananas comosus TaxID=4615 RepID=A0A6P5GX11_ANACO|nr:probable E3 ubiquitin-protein ligase XBOS36 [Ananas comosus]
MGNSMGCSSFGERMAAAARDGDAAEVRKLLDVNPGLARSATFGSLNSPLHFAAAKGHNEVVRVLLENGADVNSRNIYGQTPLMQACRCGHWEVVQTFLLFNSNALKVECVSSRTALHFAAAGGHIRCIRLLAANFAPDISSGATADSKAESKEDDRGSALSSFINKPASGGVTAIHMAALNGHFECVHLLLDLHANIAAQSLTYATSSTGSIGAGSTPLHYAACGGNFKCCQVLLARGASRLAVNCNGWLPIDVAKIWGCHWLETLLSPKSRMIIPAFPPSSYLSLPLTSILNIARKYGLQLSPALSDDSDDNDVCAVCLERSCNVAAEGCGHELCVRCALNLCSTIKANEMSEAAGSIPCPLCRSGILSFRKLPTLSPKEHESNLPVRLGNKCCLNPSDRASSVTTCKSELCKNRVEALPSEAIDALPCTPFSSSAILS